MAAHDDLEQVLQQPDVPGVRRVAQQLSQWISATHHGTVHASHLQGYLDEFAFRFNHRTARSPGPLFRQLLERAVALGLYRRPRRGALS